MPLGVEPSQQISIHALCEEGDSSHRHFSLRELYFYPRPLRGGRLLDTLVKKAYD